MGDFLEERVVKFKLALQESQQRGIAGGIGIVFKKYLLAMPISGGQIGVIEKISSEHEMPFPSHLHPVCEVLDNVIWGFSYKRAV